MFGNDSTNLADTLGSLSTVLGVEGKLAEAEAARRENLAIRRKALGNDNFRVATSLDALGTILQGERKLAEAETSFREALAIRRKVFGEQSSQVRDTLARLNEVLKAEGKPAAASINQDLDANRSKPDERAIVQPAQPFLTENLAVAKAWETLAADGYKTNEWRLQEWHNPSPALQQKAPDGTVEIFLLRNPVETISGTISFTKPGEHFREYRIRLEGNRVTCSYFRGL
jgi:hypothetical protein